MNSLQVVVRASGGGKTKNNGWIFLLVGKVSEWCRNIVENFSAENYLMFI